MAKTALKERTPDLLKDVTPSPETKLPAKTETKAKPQATAIAIRDAGAPSSANISSALVAAASNPKVDAEKMRALWDLHKEIKAEEARVAFLEDFHAMTRKLPIVEKNGKIVIEAKAGKRGQSTPFAKYEDIHEVLKPLLDEFRFTMDHATEPSEDGTRINVVSYLRHTGGHEKRTVFPLPAETSGSKNNVQGWGSSNAYGKRYNTINLLNINSKAPQDADRDGAKDKGEDSAPKRIDADQVKKISAAIEFCGVGAAKFCEKYEIEKIDDLPPERFNEAMKACQEYATKSNKK